MEHLHEMNANNRVFFFCFFFLFFCFLLFFFLKILKKLKLVISSLHVTLSQKIQAKFYDSENGN